MVPILMVAVLQGQSQAIDHIGEGFESTLAGDDLWRERVEGLYVDGARIGLLFSLRQYGCSWQLIVGYQTDQLCRVLLRRLERGLT